MGRNVIVVGAGGHAKVCIDSLRLAGYIPTACVGLNGDPTECLGVSVVYGDERLEEFWAKGHRLAFIALGPNRTRSRLAEYATGMGFGLVNAIHPASVVSATASIGAGVAIMAGAVVNAATTISDLCIVNTGATIDHDCRIGKAVHVGPQCGVAGNVAVGDRTFLGIGSRVIPDLTIGRDVMVGAGASVVRNVADEQTVVGVPARPITKRR